MTAELHRLVVLAGVLTIALIVLFAVIFVVVGTSEWLRAIAKRRRRIRAALRVAAGEQAREIQPTPPPVAALLLRGQRDREIEMLNRQLNLPYTGTRDD